MVPLGVALAGLLLVGKYGQVVAVLRYLLLGFVAFGAAAVMAHPDWPRLLKASLVPALSLSRNEVAGGLALLGTTLTSYVYVWETIGRGVGEPPDGTPEASGLARARAGARRRRLHCRDLVVMSSPPRRHSATITRRSPRRRTPPGRCAHSPAPWLRPFAAGLVTSAVVALPVLMATTAYVVGAHFGWRRGLSEGIGHARGFYAVLVAAIGLALAVTLANISVIGMLVAASVIGGLGTPIGLVILVRLARDPQVMGPADLPPSGSRGLGRRGRRDRPGRAAPGGGGGPSLTPSGQT